MDERLKTGFPIVVGNDEGVVDSPLKYENDEGIVDSPIQSPLKLRPDKQAGNDGGCGFPGPSAANYHR